MWVISIGNAYCGMDLYGPFSSRQDAEDFDAEHRTDGLIIEVHRQAHLADLTRSFCVEDKAS
jgi:hypothetical protein